MIEPVPRGKAPPVDAARELRLSSLLIEVGAGSHAAFEAAYPQLARLAFGMAWRVLRDPTLAEEVAQDVLLEVWVRSPAFDPEKGTAKSWVATIAHRRAVDRVRAVHASRRRDTLWSRPVIHPDPVPSEVQTHLDAQQVRCAMAFLTDLQRRAVELAYYDGLTYRQVAEQLGVPLGTVKSRIRDGLLRLRTGLDLIGVDPGSALHQTLKSRAIAEGDKGRLAESKSAAMGPSRSE